MTVTVADLILSVEILVVTMVMFVAFRYTFREVQRLRSEVHSLRGQLNGGDTE